MIKHIVYIAFATIFISFFCSCNNEKDQIVYQQFQQLMMDSKSWYNYLDKFTDTVSINDKEYSEINLFYFFRNTTESKIYSEIAFYKRYFEIDSDEFDMVHFAKTTEKKTNNNSMFYIKSSNRAIPVKKLIEVEKELYEQYELLDVLIQERL